MLHGHQSDFGNSIDAWRGKLSSPLHSLSRSSSDVPPVNNDDSSPHPPAGTISWVTNPAAWDGSLGRAASSGMEALDHPAVVVAQPPPPVASAYAPSSPASTDMMTPSSAVIARQGLLGSGFGSGVGMAWNGSASATPLSSNPLYSPRLNDTEDGFVPFAPKSSNSPALLRGSPLSAGGVSLRQNSLYVEDAVAGSASGLNRQVREWVTHWDLKERC